MKLKRIDFTNDGYATVRSEHVKMLHALDTRTLDLDEELRLVRVDDRSPGGGGLVYYPIEVIRCLVPLEEPEAKPVKKAPGQ